MIISNRVKSFAWRAGLFTVLAVTAYTANVSDIREIDFYKLGTIFVVAMSSFVGSEITKHFNS